MRRFWELVTRPILLERHPKRIVEIGSQAGESTRLLLEACRELGAHADIVDPAPPRNLEQIHELLDAHGAYHRSTSLDALETLPPADVYLIDGDHNWHTVSNELAAIHRRASQPNLRPPTIILHDIDWPYGRRDAYYDVGFVPDEHRQEATKGGVVPGRSEVVPNEGMNQHLMHACHEGGPRNGVRAAVEDFLQGHDEYRFFALPGYHGLGFLVPVVDDGEAYAARIAEVCSSNDAVITLLQRVESDRVAALAREETVRATLRTTRQALSETTRTARAEAARCVALEKEIAVLKARPSYRAFEALRKVRRRLKRRRG